MMIWYDCRACKTAPCSVMDRCACTVDTCHPNDLGFYRMADAITPILVEALIRAEK